MMAEEDRNIETPSRESISDNYNTSGKKQAKTGFVLGLISIVAWIIPLIGLPVSIAGIIFSSLGLKSADKKKFAVIGLCLSILFLIASLLNAIAGALIGL